VGKVESEGPHLWKCQPRGHFGTNRAKGKKVMNDRRLDGIEIDSRVCDYIYLDHTGLSFDDTISKDDDKNQNKIIKHLRRIYFRAGRSTADEQQSQLRDFEENYGN